MTGRLHIQRCLVSLLIAVCAANLQAGNMAADMSPEGSAAERRLSPWRFHPGDDINWRQPAIDDSDWIEMTVLTAKRLPWFRPRGWYRCRFQIDRECTDARKLGLWLGRVESADEVFLNGERIGGEGVVGDAFVDAPGKLRLYRVPPELLADENILAVRVQNSFPSGGLLGKPMLGDYSRLSEKRYRLERGTLVREALFCGIILAMGVFWFFITVHGLKQLEVHYFGGLMAGLGLLFVSESLLFYETGLLTPVVARVSITICILLPVPVLGLVQRLSSSGSFRRWAQRLMKICIVFAAVYLCFGNLAVCLAMYALWIPIVGGTMVLLALCALNGSIRRAPEFQALTVGFGVFGICVAVSIFLGMADCAWHRLPLNVGDGALVLAAAYGLTARFARMHVSLRAVSGRLLTIQEDERKRLSRELHDGLGQALLATCLNLKWLRNRDPAEKTDEFRGIFDTAIEETERNVRHLRETVNALRPPSLSELGFCSAVRDLANGTLIPPSMHLQFDLDEDIELGEALEDNLYRIAQEAITNVAKHSGAEQVTVRFEKRGRTVFLDIKDNGRGFDLATDRQKGSGIGLFTMQERLVPFDGRLMVESALGKGTHIAVQVEVS